MPLGLTVREARDLGPRLIRVGSLLPVRDEIADTVFQGHAEHILVEQSPKGVWAAEQVEAESIGSLEAKAEDPGEEMVVRRTMTANHFLPNGHPTMQQQVPPLVPRGRKRP